MDGTARKININEITPDMVLARDVVTMNGAILLAKNTMLDSVNAAKLFASGVGYIYVKEGSISHDTAKSAEKERLRADLERQRIPVVTRPEFIEFEKEVYKKEKQAQKYIHAISDGGTVELQQMFQITDDIMGKFPRKSDILTFMSYIKESDEHTFHHSVNVSMLCNLFGHWLGLDNDEMVELTTAGMLHDIGKTKIPNEILNKKGKLTKEEFDVMKQHSVLGYRILQHQDIPETIKLGALMHHEKMDGSGYPMGIKSDQIGKLSKIITICDIYEAMTANRVYRGKICPFEVIKTFETKVYGELDTHYLLIFLRNIAYTYIGQWVKLTNGTEAEVVFINGANLSKPIVRTLDEEYINLSTEANISIESLV
ncbi:MAG: HD-GYP domain-containing protein [Clostridiales bacterium]|jgi:putative nucleotidyltransferase with HDIG domain|nr:HD-GYP domain-containing protein [Clostridiales bacterium]